MRFALALPLLALLASGAAAQATIAECGFVDFDGALCDVWRSNVTGKAYLLEDDTSPWTGQTMQFGEQFFVTGTVDTSNCFTWCGVEGGCVLANVNSICPDDQVGTRTCFGDGSTAPCPCGNPTPAGAEEGCEHGGGTGATLFAVGSDVVANDDLEFTAQRARASQPGVLLQGAASIVAPFKDGLLCAGAPTERVEVIFTDAAGEATSSVSVVTEGNVAPGDVRTYQYWFRDPLLTPCGTGSNLTNAVVVDWI